MRIQTNLLATIIKEVVFDPDAGSISVTLVDDATEQIMSAKSIGSSAKRQKLSPDFSNILRSLSLDVHRNTWSRVDGSLF